MRTRRLQLFGFSLLGLTGLVHAQDDGDHLITNPVGQTSLATDLQVPVAPVNLTVGTTPGLGATLRVRGDQLAVNSGVNTGLCTFRTDVASGVEQGWELWRDDNQVGRIWHYGLNGPAPGGHRALHIQSKEPRDDGQDRYSGVFLMNNDDDGFWLSHNGPLNGWKAKNS